MNTSIKLSSVIFTVILFLSISIGGQSFEGKIFSKNISINIMALDELIYGNEESDMEEYDEEDESEEYSFDGPQIPIKIMEQYFSLSLDDMKKAVERYKSEYGEEYMDQPLYEETTSEILIKDSKIRVNTEEEGMKMSMIMNSENPVAKIIRWEEKVVINMDFEKILGHMEEMLGEDSYENDTYNRNKPSLKATGETKKINGFMCELYKGTDAENNYEHVWLTKSIDEGLLRSFSRMSEYFSKLNYEVENENEMEFYAKNNSIPILSKGMSGGEIIEIEEILKIEKAAVDNSQFEIPKGFQEVDMSQMMQEGFE